MRHKKRSISFPNFIEVNQKLITDRRAIVNQFNDYFVNIAKKLNDSKPETDFKDFSAFLKNRVEETIFLNEIESCEIDSIIAKLNPNKSSDMSPRVLKLFRTAISPIFSILITFSHLLLICRSLIAQLISTVITTPLSWLLCLLCNCDHGKRGLRRDCLHVE